uniref:Secreted protein n=1 Tax=Steinernema glaseri TaxID=37863 RepID=A0A1I7ZDZ2_9BILA
MVLISVGLVSVCGDTATREDIQAWSGVSEENERKGSDFAVIVEKATPIRGVLEPKPGEGGTRNGPGAQPGRRLPNPYFDRCTRCGDVMCEVIFGASIVYVLNVVGDRLDENFPKISRLPSLTNASEIPSILFSLAREQSSDVRSVD